MRDLRAATADTVTGGDRIQRIASWIVTSGVKVVTTRDLTRNVTGMRGLGSRDIHARVSPLVAGGWLVPDQRGPESTKWHFILLLEHWGALLGRGTTLAIDNIDKVRVGHSRSKLSRGRALSHSAAALSERKSRWALFKSSFNEAANLDEEKLEGTI